MNAATQLGSWLCGPDTDAVSFRPMELFDALRIHEWLDHPAVAAGIHSRPVSYEETRGWVEAWLDEEDALRLMIRRDIQEVGFIHLDHIESPLRRLWLGLIVVDPNRTGEGIGSAALRVLLGRIEDSGLYDRVLLRVDASNARAVAVHGRAGFVRIAGHRLRAPEDQEREQYVMERVLAPRAPARPRSA